MPKGGTAVYPGKYNPERPDDENYAYVFSGWDRTLTNIMESFSTIAQFTKTGRDYTITWVDGNGKTLETDRLKKGETPTYDSSIVPTKDPTAQTTYTFTGWDPEVVPVTKDATYTATFSENVRTYTVTWANYNGSVILETDKNVPYGTMPEFNGNFDAIPPATGYDRTFDGWDPEVVPVTNNAVYHAKFTSTLHKYAITWCDGDGNVLKTDEVEYYSVPSYSGPTPTKKDSAVYSYAWDNKWSPTVTRAKADVTYTATFSGTQKPVKGAKLMNYGRGLSIVTSEGFLLSSGKALSDKVYSETKTDRYLPYYMPFSGGKIKKVVGEASSNALLTEEGDIYMWGLGSLGVLGSTSNSGYVYKDITKFTALGEKKFVDVSIGLSCGGAVTTDGELYMWGTNNHYVLGKDKANGTTIYAPFKIDLGSDKAAAVDCGDSVTAVLTTAGEVYVTGMIPNAAGEAITETFTKRAFPAGILAKTVATTATGCLATTTANDIYFLGNNHSEIGGCSNSGYEVYKTEWCKTDKLGNIKAAAVNGGNQYNIMVLTTTGELYVWGLHIDGFHGDGVNLTSKETALTEIMPGTKFIDAGFDDYNGFGITEERNIIGWGRLEYLFKPDESSSAITSGTVDITSYFQGKLGSVAP